ncbi:MAG: hypothetical protein ACYS8X_12420 [Planctomycetota bacterium]|jgi:hypothetical protein
MTVTSHDHRRPCFEALESRLLLDGAVWAGIAGDELRITGDAAANNVVLTGLDSGGYKVTGIHHAGGMTTINGATFVEFANVPILRIVADLGGGDDVMNVGSTDALDTTIDDILDVSGGHGTNILNIGRVQQGSTLYFAGQVTVNAMVVFDNQTFGNGNVFVAGAHMASFDAHLGYGEGEKSVVIADLWHGMTYHPPSDILDVRTLITSDLTIANPAGQVDVLIDDTNATVTTISTADGDDDIDLYGVHFEATAITTYDGEDSIEFAESEYRSCEIFGLAIETGRHSDTIFMSDTVVELYTAIHMGLNGIWEQALHISAFGGCELTQLTVGGRGVTVTFNDFVGVNETLINGTFSFVTDTGLDVDRADMRNVEVTGAVTVALRGGDDSVSIHECDFHADAGFLLSQGNDTFLMGQLFSSLLLGDDTQVGDNLVVDMGDGADQVGITKLDMDGMVLVSMGASAGRGQRVRIATVGGTVQTGNLGITGEGRTNVYIGNTIEPHPSVDVDGILSILTGMDRSRDTVVIQNAYIRREMVISTGGGNDLLMIQRSAVNHDFLAHMGDGVDVVSIWDCDFGDDAEFYGDGMRDVMWILDSHFADYALFDGGDARDVINRSIVSRNGYDQFEEPTLRSIEAFF